MASYHIIKGRTTVPGSFRFDARCKYEGSRRVYTCGTIHILPFEGLLVGQPAYVVRHIDVNEAQQRKGIATKLYATAATEACRRGGRLASLGEDRQPGAFSHDFWSKQERKGRVTRAQAGGQKNAPTFVITTCPPPSLAGAASKSRRVPR